jgi:DNA-directed RNA polymerase specialized sigma24 family protein
MMIPVMNNQTWGLANGSGSRADSRAALTTYEELRCLNVEHRTAIVRAYYFNESVSEMARRESVPEDVVKSQLHDGAHALRLAIRERGAPDD